MKKKVQYLLFFFLFVMITGCKSAEEHMRESRSLALKTMQQRYGEEFVYVEDAPKNEPCYSLEFCYPYQFYVTPKEESSPLYNQNIYVSVDKKKDKKEVYENYIALQYQDDIEEVFHSIIDTYFQDFHLQYSGFNYRDDTNHFTKNTTLNDYLMDEEKRHLYVILEVRESEFQEEILPKLLEQINSKMRKFYVLLIVSKDEFYGESSIDDLAKQTSLNDFSKIVAYAKIENFGEPELEFYNSSGKVE